MTNNHINYIEFKAKDLQKVKAFYTNAFGWKFTDYGKTYTAFSDSGIDGGFELSGDKIVYGVLVVLYHANLDEAKGKVLKSGGTISKEIFDFPGGRRFQFFDPSGNELAVWSEK